LPFFGGLFFFFFIVRFFIFHVFLFDERPDSIPCPQTFRTRRRRLRRKSGPEQELFGGGWQQGSTMEEGGKGYEIYGDDGRQEAISMWLLLLLLLAE
jgi:hypothetical protein